MNRMPAPEQQGGGPESDRARHRLQPRAERPVAAQQVLCLAL
jgi:hypothetical protein